MAPIFEQYCSKRLDEKIEKQTLEIDPLVAIGMHGNTVVMVSM
jgi:hypothetical protein